MLTKNSKRIEKGVLITYAESTHKRSNEKNEQPRQFEAGNT